VSCMVRRREERYGRKSEVIEEDGEDETEYQREMREDIWCCKSFERHVPYDT